MNSRGEYEPRTVSKSYSERSGERKGYKLATRKDSGSREPRYREPTRDKHSGMASGSASKPPVILTRSKKSDPVLVPGSISIITREPGQGVSPTGGTLLKSGMGEDGDRGTPPSTSPTTRTSTREDSYPSSRSRREISSSSASSFVPLQPKHRPPRGEISRESVPMGRTDGSLFSIATPESSHAVKILDDNWLWNSRGNENLMEQPDFLVVGCLGLQGVGKSTIMSLLAGSRTGSGRPQMFRPQSKDTQDHQGYQTSGIDLVVTTERVILLDVQPILSNTMMEQLATNEGVVPDDLSPEMFVEIQSLQLAVLLMAICHVVVVVMDSMEMDTILRFLNTAGSLKPSCVGSSLPTVGDDVSDSSSSDQMAEYYPHIVFVHNHATPDDFQPYSMKQAHTQLAQSFATSPLKIAGGASLMKSGIIPLGTIPNAFSDSSVNLHLLPTNENLSENGGPLSSRPAKLEYGLNPILSLLPNYTSHPSYQVLVETLRNQIFSIPRHTLSYSSQQMTEKDWFTYAEKMWNTIKKSNLLSKYEELLQTLPE